MKKQKRSSRINLPAFFDDIKAIFFQKLSSVLVVFVFIVVSVFLFKAFIHGSDYFRLRSVETKGLAESSMGFSVNKALLKLYKDKNIFDIDLKAISKSLAARYPDAKHVIVKRSLPDSISIVMSIRRPVAILSGIRSNPVDDEGYTLINADPKGLSELPAITGIDIKYDPKNPRMVESVNLRAALGLLKETKRAKYFNGYRLTKIDARDINKICLYLDESLEVRIGYENYKDRLVLLRNTLKDPRVLKDRIAYIDVRFHDVSIGEK